MLTAIKIDNFRCFEQLKVDGFKTINLIGGLNNSGKTALLEAIFLAFFSDPNALMLLRLLRRENDAMIKKLPNDIWNYFFFNKNTEKPIELIAYFENKNSLFEVSSYTSSKFTFNAKIDDIYKSLSQDIKDAITKYNVSSFLSIHRKEENSIDAIYHLLPAEKIHNLGTRSMILPNPAPYLGTIIRFNDAKLADMYSQAKSNKKITIFNEILNLLDNRINGSEIDAPGGEPCLNAVLENGQSFPISMLGDAIKKITELVLLLLSTSSKVIFIDEIENGIHFTKHKFLWQKLFKIAKTQQIQIFATSHSGEMIKAFNDVAIADYADDAMYFELSRARISNKIVVNPMDTEMLGYEIYSNQSYRGE
jgi:AAA15 family ATPase/GTPase